jgi:hypothetical protein
VCSGGLGTYTFSYTTSTNPAGVNQWKVRTVETLPDGNQNIVYTNAYGEVMLKSFQDVTTGQQWVNFYEYNLQGQVVLAADPSAVAGYNDAYGDLMHWTGLQYQYLYAATGLITLFGYGVETTATRSTARDVIGLVQYSALEHGDLGPLQVQEVFRYYHRWVGGAEGSAVSPLALDTVYADGATAASVRTTSYSYSAVAA